MTIRFDSPEAQTFGAFRVTQIAPDTFIEGVAGLDLVIVPADSATEVHRHNHSDNVIFVLRGRARAVLEGAVHEVRAGMRVVIPRGVSHGFLTDAEPLEFVSIQIPPILDVKGGVFDREILG